MKPLLLCLLLTTPALAGSVIETAKCTIEANKRLPAGKELDKAVKACYSNMPAEVYAHRHPSDNSVQIVEGNTYQLQGPTGPDRGSPVHTPGPYLFNGTVPLRSYPYPYYNLYKFPAW